jgi:hypothetical protein
VDEARGGPRMEPEAVADLNRALGQLGFFSSTSLAT